MLEPFSVGATVGNRYLIEKELGRGAMGAVYLAKDIHTGGAVAIKELLPSIQRDVANIQRFHREARVLHRALNSPENRAHIVQLLDFKLDEQDRFIVLEYVTGVNLEETLTSGPFAVEQALDYAEQIAKGLATLHSLKIVHRDLKPGNLVLRPDGTVCIIDFGIAKPIEDAENSSDRVTREGYAVGSPWYMPLAAIMGEKPTPSHDVWALGIILYEMLAGTRPFQTAETSVGSYVQFLVRNPRADILAVRQGTPSLVQALIDRLLCHEEGVRPRDGTAALDAIADVCGRLQAREKPSKNDRSSVRRSDHSGAVRTKSQASVAQPSGSTSRRSEALRFRRFTLTAVAILVAVLVRLWTGATPSHPPSSSAGKAPPTPASVVVASPTTTNDAARRLLIRWRAAGSHVGTAWFDRYRRNQRRVLKQDPGLVARDLQEHLQRHALASSLREFLKTAPTYFASKETSNAERLAVNSALVDIERLEAWCEENGVTWDPALSVARVPDAASGTIYPTAADVALGATWNIFTTTRSLEMVKPLNPPFLQDYELTYTLPDLPSAVAGIIWFTTVDFTSRFALEVTIDGAYRSWIRNRANRFDEHPMQVNVRELISAHHFKTVGPQRNIAWTLAPEPELRNRRCFVGRRLPAGVLHGGPTKVRIRFQDLAEYPVNSVGEMGIGDKLLTVFAASKAEDRRAQ